MAQPPPNVDKKNSWGRTPLHYAVLEGNLNRVTELLDKGADVNALIPSQYSFQKGMSSLYVAANKGHLEIVKLLLERGAHLDKRVVENIEKERFPPTINAFLGELLIEKRLTESTLPEKISRAKPGTSGHNQVMKEVGKFLKPVNIKNIKNIKKKSGGRRKTLKGKAKRSLKKTRKH